MAVFKIRFSEMDKVIECRSGETFIAAAQRGGVAIATACGGEGKCKSCAVRVVAGAVPAALADDAKVFSQAQLDNGWRRSCQMVPSGDCTVHLPRRSLMAQSHHLVAGDQFAPLPVDPTVAHGPKAFGVAIDLGTTNIVAFLIHLKTGTTLAAINGANPQAPFGGDVVSRLTQAMRNDDDRTALRTVVVDGLNGYVAELCANAMVEPQMIVDMLIVGNTAMHHLFLGLPIKQLCRAPFVPDVRHPMDRTAQDLGLQAAPGATVHLPGIIAGYVGSDHTTALLASRKALGGGLSLIVDIGTNTEISLVDGERIISASCPSGPALEGGAISYGMPAAEGAIAAVAITGDELRLKTVDDAPPIGLCGSGVLDMVAQLYLCGAVNARGRLDAAHPRVISHGGRLEFIIVDEADSVEGVVSFAQDDVRAVQLAKAAIRAGIDLLLDAMGRAEADICHVVVAGAFGNYIDLNSAIAIGLLPDIPLKRFDQVGNAAGKGACLALTSKTERERAAELADTATYLELSGHPEFMKVFAGRINFA